jgi:hypothetical protein
MNDFSIKKQPGRKAGYKHSETTKLKIKEHHAKYWCGKTQSEESNEKRHNALSGEGCYWYVKSIPPEVKAKMSFSHKGIRPSLETKKRISKTLVGVPKPLPASEETREKRRIIRLKQIESKFGGTNFNTSACDFIDTLNRECGSNFRHAKNGKEKWIAGYAVDGYDSDRNVVVEYDEKHHYDLDNNLKPKDCVRQQKIVERINPSLFLRYDENRKRLYDAIKGTNFTLDTLKKQLQGKPHDNRH